MKNNKNLRNNKQKKILSKYPKQTKHSKHNSLSKSKAEESSTLGSRKINSLRSLNRSIGKNNQKTQKEGFSLSYNNIPMKKEIMLMPKIKKELGQLILPKLYFRDINVNMLPEKVDIYTKVKIKDIINLAKLTKPIFK